MHERWFSRRAIFLHLGLVLFVPGCALAAWWQITRAQDGNGLSYLYSIEWPAFAILGVYFWWMFIHTDYENVGLKGMRKQEAAAGRLTGNPVGTEANDPTSDASPAAHPSVYAEGEEPDAELVAYNERLAELSAKGPKTWRNPETLVARRPR